MSQTRIGNAYPDRNTFRDRIGDCKTVEQLSNVVRDLLHAIPFRGEVNDVTGRSKISLANDTRMGGSAHINRTIAVPNSPQPGPAPLPSSDVQGTISQELPGTNPAGATNPNPEITMVVKGFNNYSFTTGSTYLDNVAYAPRTPQHEVLLRVDIGGRQMYARLPLMDNPDEAVPRPLVGWRGTIEGTDDKLNALQQMHNDLVQSLLKFGVLRCVERVSSDKIEFGQGPG